MSLRYEVDPHNKLVVKKTGSKTGVSKFRRVIEGKFKIGKGNRLIYHIKAPSGGIAKELDLPHQIKFKGNWTLTRGHDLRLTLNKWRRQTFGDELTLKGDIIKVNARSLLFAVTQRTKENIASTYILRLEGWWLADKNNRLAFRAKKESGRSDLLVLDGVWLVNKKHRVAYSYESWAGRAGRRVKRHTLTFDGFWNLTEKEILTYLLDFKGKSVFDFRVGKGIARRSMIGFEVGIGISRRKKPLKKDIILYGKWKVKKGIGLIFEIKYGRGRVSAIKFGAEAKLLGKSRVKFNLRNEAGRGLGITLTLSKRMLKGDGESFIRFLYGRKEKAAYVGAGFRW